METVTAVDLAQELGRDPKAVRRQLRAWRDAGHPLLRGHQHLDRWVFSRQDADQLKAELRAGTSTPSRAISARPAPQTAPVSGAATAGPSATLTAAVLQHRLHGAANLTRESLPYEPGLYAWWAPVGVLTGVAHVDGRGFHEERGFELLYVGIAGDLAERIVGRHLGRATGSSTLRRTFGAWVGQEQGWAREWRAERVQHDRASEERLTGWMRANLFVSWALHPSPRDVEAAVIGLLSPPLNHAHNRAHPNWLELERRRSQWRAWPISSEGR